MKRFIQILIVTFLFSQSIDIYAQTGNTVAKEVFKKMYPKAFWVEWKSEAGQHTVNFQLKEQEKTAVYDSHGAWCETSTYITPEVLVPRTIKLIQQRHPGGSLEEIIKVEKPGLSCFEIMVLTKCDGYQVVYLNEGQKKLIHL